MITYFNSNVDTAFTFNSDTTEINVLFNIKEGRSFILSDINYFGLDDLDQNIKNLVFSSNNISTGQIYNKNNINLDL